MYFDPCLTYESGPYEYDDFPQTDEIVYLLGRQYSALYDIEELRDDVLSRLWFTYRRNFSPIGGLGPTCDAGWGCMLRCGQMILAQALCMLHLGRSWRWTSRDRHYNDAYMKILNLFIDRKKNYYSIHQIASMGVTEGKVVGQWYGPNTIAQVLKKLSVYDEWSSLAIHIALDNTIIEDDIRLLCNQAESRPTANTKTGSSTQNIANGETISPRNLPSPQVPKVLPWKPLLLVIPLRLGLSDINKVYISSLKKCLSFKQSVGIIGGKPNHALWFIGYVGDEIVYLDPHTTQPYVDPDMQRFTDESFHCAHACRMKFQDLDPSLALGFFCKTEEEFEDLCRRVYKEIINPHKLPMFELHKTRPSHWPTFKPGSSSSHINPAEYHMVRTSDTEEEFELL